MLLVVASIIAHRGALFCALFHLLWLPGLGSTRLLFRLLLLTTFIVIDTAEPSLTMEMHQSHSPSHADNDKQPPNSHCPLPDSSAALTKFLATNSSIQYIRYQWVDYSGVLRVRILPKSHCISLAAGNKPVVLGPCAHTLLVNNTIFDWSAIGIDRLYPDWASLRRTNSGEDGNLYASVMCWTNEPRGSDEDTACQRCPRTAMQNVLNQAKDLYGLDILIGFEVEFMLVGTSEDGLRYQLLQNGGVWTASTCRTKAFTCLEECADALRSMDVAVQQFHSEGRSGQLEISLAPLQPMEAIDTLILTHEVIKNVAFKHGHEATMYPKPFADHPANGAHTHLSIHPPHLEEHFLAGLLDRLPMLCAFTMPTPESYVRVHPVEAGDWIAWGLQNRTVPVRKIGPGHWELRFFDAAANMYLALSACIGAGLLGLRNKEDLRWSDCQSWCSRLSDTDRRSLGIVKQLPRTRSEAIQSLEEGKEDLQEMMSGSLLDRYIQIRKWEDELFRSMKVEDVRNLYLQKMC